VQSNNKGEVIVQGNNIAAHVYMGDKLCLYSGDEIIILKSTFPMQTISKCSVISGNIKKIRPGMKVYRYKARK